MQQQTFKFSRKARTELCFDVKHGWCNIQTSFRIWHPDMQPVGAFWVCAFDLCHVMGPANVLLIRGWPYVNAVEDSCFGRVWSLIMQIWFWKVITGSVWCQIKAKEVQTGFQWWTTGRHLIQRRHHSRYNPPSHCYQSRPQAPFGIWVA